MSRRFSSALPHTDSFAAIDHHSVRTRRSGILSQRRTTSRIKRQEWRSLSDLISCRNVPSESLIPRPNILAISVRYWIVVHCAIEVKRFFAFSPFDRPSVLTSSYFSPISGWRTESTQAKKLATEFETKTLNRKILREARFNDSSLNSPRIVDAVGDIA